MSLATDASPARIYRRDIDGLRAIAILSVVLYHAGFTSLPGGFVGVDVFFVISGYLIGGHINSELIAHKFRFAAFYRNRAKRILPALYTVLTLTLIIGFAVLSPRELRDLAISTFATTASASNVLLWRTTNYFAPRADQNPLLMTWSLGVEEQFYLVIPVLLVLLARIRQRLSLPLILVLSAGSFLIATYQVHHSPTSAFYLLDSRAWELGIGVALAILESEMPNLTSSRTGGRANVLGGTGLLLILGSLFLLNSSTPFPGPAAVPAVIGSALLLASSRSWVSRTLLSSEVAVYVGRISYSFYLLHWPLLSYLHVLSGGSLPLRMGLAAVAVAFFLAVLSYRVIEVPFRSSSLPAGMLLIRYGVLSLGMLLVSGVLYKANGLPSRYAFAAQIDNLVISTHHDPCLAEDGNSLPRLSPACTGAGHPGTHVALWGDSHASAFSPALRSLAAKQGYFLEEYGKTTCPPLLGVGRSYTRDPALLRECIQFNASVLNRLKADPQVSVVVLVAFWDGAFDPRTTEGKLATINDTAGQTHTQRESESLLRSSLAATLQTLTAAGKRVVVFGDTPVFDTDPVWRMRSSNIPIRRRLVTFLRGRSFQLDPGADQAFDATDSQSNMQLLLKAVSTSFPGVTFWEPRKQLCDSNQLCTYREGETILFVDTNHVSPEGAEVALRGWVLPPSRNANEGVLSHVENHSLNLRATPLLTSVAGPL